MNFVLHLSRFEGPLDLLLYLIEKNRFTIEDLEICPIVDQYLAYINALRSLDISLAGEFLEMASYLIYVKSCFLLPKPELPGAEEGEDPARQLQEMLVAYQALKQASRQLGERPLLFRDRFPRGSSPQEQHLAPMNMSSLLQAVASLRAHTRSYVIKVASEGHSIRDTMARIYARLQAQGRVALSSLLQQGSRSERIAVFLAALELSKNSVARLMQPHHFADILLVWRQSVTAGQALDAEGYPVDAAS